MDVSLSSFVGYSEKRAGQPVHEEADVLVYLRGFSGCDWLHLLLVIGEIVYFHRLVVTRRQCVFCPFEDSFFSFMQPSESSSNSVSFWLLLTSVGRH